MRKIYRRRGTVLVEFTLAGIASIMLLISTFQLAMAMWNYHTLAYAIHEGDRYAAVKGRNCTLPGNSCSVSVATIAQKIASIGVGLPADKVNLTLTTDSGIVTSCTPLNSCYTNTAIWPPSNTSHDNYEKKSITIAAKYQSSSVFLFFWPGAG